LKEKIARLVEATCYAQTQGITTSSSCSSTILEDSNVGSADEGRLGFRNLGYPDALLQD